MTTTTTPQPPSPSPPSSHENPPAAAATGEDLGAAPARHLERLDSASFSFSFSISTPTKGETDDDVSTVLMGLLPSTPVAVFHDGDDLMGGRDEDSHEGDTDLLSVAVAVAKPTPPPKMIQVGNAPSYNDYDYENNNSNNNDSNNNNNYNNDYNNVYDYDDLQVSSSSGGSPMSWSVMTPTPRLFAGPNEGDRDGFAGHRRPSLGKYRYSGGAKLDADGDVLPSLSDGTRQSKRRVLSIDPEPSAALRSDESISPQSHHTLETVSYSIQMAAGSDETRDLTEPSSTPPARDSHSLPTYLHDEGKLRDGRRPRGLAFPIAICALASVIVGSAIGFIFFGMNAPGERSKAGDGGGSSKPPPTLAPSWSSDVSPRERVIRTMLHPRLPPVTLDALKDTTSKQYEAMAWILEEDTYLNLPTSLDDLESAPASDLRALQKQLLERFVLSVLYFELDGDFWPEGNLFLSGVGTCDWHDPIDLNGVFCGDDSSAATDSVSRLHFALVQQFRGTLPPEIGLLTGLKELHIVDTGVGGSLPSELGLLTSLTHLDLSSNDLDGQLPSEIGNLRSLNAMHLGDNSFRGTVPQSFGSIRGLEEVTLGFNDLTGSLDSIFCSMEEPEVLVADCPNKIACSCCTSCCDDRGTCKSV